MQLMFRCPQGIHAVHAFLKNEKKNRRSRVGPREKTRSLFRWA